MFADFYNFNKVFSSAVLDTAMFRLLRNRFDARRLFQKRLRFENDEGRTKKYFYDFINFYKDDISTNFTRRSMRSC